MHSRSASNRKTRRLPASGRFPAGAFVYIVGPSRFSGCLSYAGRKIGKIKTVKKRGQAAFAELVSVAQPSGGAYETGRPEPKIETVIQIAQHFDLSVNLLLTNGCTADDLYEVEQYQPTLLAAPAAREQAASHPGPAPAAPFVPAAPLLECMVRRHEAAYHGALLSLLLLPQLRPTAAPSTAPAAHSSCSSASTAG